MENGKSYVSFDSGLLMDTKYLTESVAYFLGGIYASEEEVRNGVQSYKIAPVRYNYKAASPTEIATHYEYVREISDSVNGRTIMADNLRGTPLDSGKNRMPGFSTLFQVTTLDNLVASIPAVRTALLASPWSVQRCFLVGMFDGRGSADINRKTHAVRYLVLDCISDDVGTFLSEMVDHAGFHYNYNCHRDRIEGGRPRNPQLRIKDVERFMQAVGLISPRRVNLLKGAYESVYASVTVQPADEVLPHLQVLVMG